MSYLFLEIQKRVVAEMAVEMETIPLNNPHELFDYEMQKNRLFFRRHLQASVPYGREEFRKLRNNLLKMKELDCSINAQVCFTY